MTLKNRSSHTTRGRAAGAKKRSAHKATARKASPRKAPSARSAPRKSAKSGGRRWSKHVMQTSDALDIEARIFKQRDPARIARSLKRSAERSKRRKSTPFRSAMSMLNFYINRGGKNLPASQKAVLERAKRELRLLYHREQPA
jgi:hypothetical protein